MYRVILIDDEINVIKVLRRLISWEQYGFEVIADASNGVEALEAIDKFHPDLVITDVDMPHINGIQLIKQMSDRKYKCKSLLLTVYKDFQYIKTAMDYGTSGYLLKPVDEDELIESLIKVRKELDGNKLLSEAFDIVKEKFLCSLIEDSVDYEEIGTDKSNLGITFSENDAFAVMVVEIDNIFDINPGEIDIEGVSRAIISDIDYIVNMTFSSCTFRDNMDRICVLLWHADKSILESKTFNVAEEFRIFTGKKSGLILTVGMSSVLRGSENLKYLYDEAVRILESAFLLGKNKVIRHAEGFYPANMTDMRKFGDLLIELHKGIENFDTVYTDEILNRIFDLVIKKKVREKSVKELIVEIFIGIGKVIREYNGDIYNVFGDDFNIFEFLQKRSTVREYKEWLNGVINDTCDYIKDIKISRPKSIVAEVVDYIEQYYCNDLTLKTLANMFYFNPLYLGQIFKKETGESFNDFLARVRIENAIRLLKKTDMKVYEIAEKVGFKGIQYYYKIFKRVTGSTPTAFRDNN